MFALQGLALSGTDPDDAHKRKGAFSGDVGALGVKCGIPPRDLSAKGQLRSLGTVREAFDTIPLGSSICATPCRWHLENSSPAPAASAEIEASEPHPRCRWLITIPCHRFTSVRRRGNTNAECSLFSGAGVRTLTRRGTCVLPRTGSIRRS